MKSGNITCSFIKDGILTCDGVHYEEHEELGPGNTWFWIYLSIYIALVLIAGLMSGLTMGLLSLDVMSLSVLQSGGKPNEQKYAKNILPLVKRHHLLLVTLLLGNAAAVESMPLFLDKISNPLTAIVISVTAVLIFGEIVPQAFCTRFGLAIGSTLAPLVYFLMFITFPISWPIAKLLDLLLGKEHGTFFRRAELTALVDIHNADQNEENEDPLTADEALIIKGALCMREKTVCNICTPIESVFALDVQGIMDSEMMDVILSKGHSRVPVFEDRKNNLLGVMLVKNLIKIDPDKCLPLREVFSLHKRTLWKISEDTRLYECLNLFQMGKSHMFIVVRKSDRLSSNCISELQDGDTIIGLITLEDVIEELIQEEIIDETDEFIDVHKKVKVAKARAVRSSVSIATSGSHPDVIAVINHQNAPLIDPYDDDDEIPLLSN